MARKLILNGGAIRPTGLLLILMECHWMLFEFVMKYIFSSAVPSGSGAFQVPTHPASSSSAEASTLRGVRANLRNASVTFSLFWHEASLG